MTESSTEEIKVLLVIVHGESTWWVFRPAKPLTPDWQSCRGHWMHPVAPEDASELRAKSLLDDDELAFEKRGLVDEIPRFSVFRANVCLRKIPKSAAFAMCAEDVTVAHEEYAIREADIAQREKKGEKVVIMNGEDASTAPPPPPATQPPPEQNTVVSQAIDTVVPPRKHTKTSKVAQEKGPVDVSDVAAAAAAQNDAAATSRFRISAANTKAPASITDAEDPASIFEHEATIHATGENIFVRSKAKRQTSRVQSSPLAPEDVQVIDIKATNARWLVIQSTVIDAFRKRPATPVAVKTAKKLPKRALSDEKDDDSGADDASPPSGNLRVSEPSRRPPRSEKARVQAHVAVPSDMLGSSSSLLSCAGYKTWTILDTALVADRPGVAVSNNNRPGEPSVYSIGNGTYVTTSDGEAVASAAAVTQASPVALDAAGDGGTDSYLEDLFASVTAAKKPE